MSKLEQALKRKYRKIAEDRNISVIFPKDNPGIAIKENGYEARLNLLGEDRVSYGTLVGKKYGSTMSYVGNKLWEKIDIVLSYWKEYASLHHFEILVLESEKDMHSFVYKNFFKPLGFSIDPPASFSNHKTEFVHEMFPLITKEIETGIFGEKKEILFLPYLELQPGKIEQLFEQRISFYDVLKVHKKEDSLFATTVIKNACFSFVLLGNTIPMKWVIKDGENALIEQKTNEIVIQTNQHITTNDLKEQFLLYKDKYIKKSRFHHLYEPNPFHLIQYFMKKVSSVSSYKKAAMTVYRELSSFYTYNEIELYFSDKENKQIQPVVFYSFKENYFVFPALEKQVVLFDYKDPGEKETIWKCVLFSKKEEMKTWISEHINQNMQKTLSVI